MWLPWLVESFPLINVNSQRKKNQKRNCNNNINIYQRTKGKPKGHSLVHLNLYSAKIIFIIFPNKKQL
jgi:hypothetical protein